MAIAPTSRAGLPVLEPGDHLSGEEFDRRYALRPDIGKAELVGGVVYMPSPVRIPEHGSPVSFLSGWLLHYRLSHPGVQTANDGSVRLGPDDHVQPDAMMWRADSGATQLARDHQLEGTPELVVEVAASSAAYDLHTKLQAYEQAGVQKYVVWRPVDGAIDWFELVEGRFEPLAAGADGYTESKVFPGLKVHAADLLSGEESKLAAALGIN